MKDNQTFILTKIEACLDLVEAGKMTASDYLKNHWLLILQDSDGKYAEELRKRVEGLLNEGNIQEMQKGNINLEFLKRGTPTGVIRSGMDNIITDPSQFGFLDIEKE